MLSRSRLSGRREVRLAKFRSTQVLQCSEGFELANCRKPDRADFVVARREQGRLDKLVSHTKKTGANLWALACREAGVERLTRHAMRHAFITLVLARRSSQFAPSTRCQKCWRASCAACFLGENSAEAPGIEPGAPRSRRLRTRYSD